NAKWTADSFVQSTIKDIREKAGKHRVLCALSGGVDSTVTATLLHRAIGGQLQCLFVNNGLLRKNEFQQVLKVYEQKLNLPVKSIDASDQFLSALEGVTDPEKKRKIIGNTFIDVFEDAVKDDKSYKFLAQGTVYPDVIES